MREFTNSAAGTVVMGFVVTFCIAITLLVVLGAVFRWW